MIAWETQQCKRQQQSVACLTGECEHFINMNMKVPCVQPSMVIYLSMTAISVTTGNLRRLVVINMKT